MQRFRRNLHTFLKKRFISVRNARRLKKHGVKTHFSDLRWYVVLILLVDAWSGVGMVHLSCMVVRRHWAGKSSSEWLTDWQSPLELSPCTPNFKRPPVLLRWRRDSTTLGWNMIGAPKQWIPLHQLTLIALCVVKNNALETIKSDRPKSNANNVLLRFVSPIANWVKLHWLTVCCKRIDGLPVNLIYPFSRRSH